MPCRWGGHAGITWPGDLKPSSERPECSPAEGQGDGHVRLLKRGAAVEPPQLCLSCFLHLISS